jgi:hypothetical protein
LSEAEEDYVMMMEENNVDVDEEEAEGKHEGIKEEGAAEVADAKERIVQELGASLRASFALGVGCALPTPAATARTTRTHTREQPMAGEGGIEAGGGPAEGDDAGEGAAGERVDDGLKD